LDNYSILNLPTENAKGFILIKHPVANVHYSTLYSGVLMYVINLDWYNHQKYRKCFAV